jgi:hypothetical protein
VNARPVADGAPCRAGSGSTRAAAKQRQGLRTRLDSLPDGPPTGRGAVSPERPGIRAQRVTVSVASLLVPFAEAVILTVFVPPTRYVLTVNVPLVCPVPIVIEFTEGFAML